MALDKGIKYGKEKRKEYYKIAQQVDKSCRCHGGCTWCLENRIHKLSNSGKNVKSPGVLKKLHRQLRNLSKNED